MPGSSGGRAGQEGVCETNMNRMTETPATEVTADKMTAHKEACLFVSYLRANRVIVKDICALS